MRFLLLLTLLAASGSGLACRPAAGDARLPPSAWETSLPATEAEHKEETAEADAGPLALVWEDLEVGIPPDSVYEPWMMRTAIKALEGKVVRITGYMHGGVAVRSGIREFVLLRNIDCPFGREGEAHHAMRVELQGKLRTDFTTLPLSVEGVFRVQPWAGPDGNTWSLYALEGTRVEASDEPPPAPGDRRN